MRARVFINCLIKGRLGSLRVVGGTIAALDEPPAAGDLVVDVRGDRVLPGFINAHDHLQLNNLPAVARAAPYGHVTEWIADINERRRHDAGFEAQVAVARSARLLTGGIKNLLSGVTTVAHHDPFYPFLAAADFPVAVPANHGWSHSLYIDGEDAVTRSFRRTPADRPWIIHAAEGVDAAAAAEFDRLDALGLLNPNTVLVHGVALDERRRARLEAAGGSLVWCPSSNLSLFGRTADVQGYLERGQVALGTDSRLSGARDILDELRSASECRCIDEGLMESIVTSASARILRLEDRGALHPGLRADLVVLPASSQLSNVRRTDVRLVVLAGEARYGDPEFSMLSSAWTPVEVDGRAKFLDSRTAALVRHWGVMEEGLVIDDRRYRAA